MVSWADRCAYCAHDLEDAASVGIVDLDDLPAEISDVAGRHRSSQLNCFVNAIVECMAATGEIGMRQPYASALASLRAFNYERIYTRPSSIAQGRTVVAVLSGLVEYFAARPAPFPSPPGTTPPSGPEAPDEEAGRDGAAALRRAVGYVSGMTDRFAFDAAVELLGWAPARLPRGIDAAGRSF